MLPDPGVRACPGCGVEIRRHLVACGRCWLSVPEELRRRAHLAFDLRFLNRRTYPAAVGDIEQWLRANQRIPIGTPPGSPFHRLIHLHR